MEKENKSNKIVIILLSVLIVLMIVGIILGVIYITSSKNQNNIGNANTVDENSEPNAIANNGSNTNYNQKKWK